MPRFAANLGHLFTERPLLERFGAAAAAGFTAVELQFPYDTPTSAVTAELKTHNLTQLAVNTPQGPEFGLAALPGGLSVLGAPRIGVAGLNPHAGEHGLFGDEEERVMMPAIAACRERTRDGAADLGADKMKALDAEMTHELAVIIDEHIERPRKFARHRG